MIFYISEKSGKLIRPERTFECRYRLTYRKFGIPEVTFLDFQYFLVISFFSSCHVRCGMNFQVGIFRTFYRNKRSVNNLFFPESSEIFFGFSKILLIFKFVLYVNFSFRNILFAAVRLIISSMPIIFQICRNKMQIKYF